MITCAVCSIHTRTPPTNYRFLRAVGSAFKNVAPVIAVGAIVGGAGDASFCTAEVIVGAIGVDVAIAVPIIVRALFAYFAGTSAHGTGYTTDFATVVVRSLT